MDEVDRLSFQAKGWASHCSLLENYIICAPSLRQLLYRCRARLAASRAHDNNNSNRSKALDGELLVDISSIAPTKPKRGRRYHRFPRDSEHATREYHLRALRLGLGELDACIHCTRTSGNLHSAAPSVYFACPHPPGSAHTRCTLRQSNSLLAPFYLKSRRLLCGKY